MPYAKAKSNETLAEVIAREGPRFSVDEVKGHPKNAGMLAARSEYILKEGDPIWIPEEEPDLPWFAVKVGDELKLTAGSVRVVRLVLRYPDGTLIKNSAFKLTLDGRVHEGTTSGDGMMEVTVGIKDTHGVVTVKGYRQAIEVGGLQPINTAKGIQARLRNLGYAVGPIDGELGLRSIKAIKAFQKACGLPVTGKMGPATSKRLETEHGC